MRRYSVRILRFLLAIALCAVVGGVVLAAGKGRTDVVKLPPIFTVETVADCGDFTVLESFYLEVTVMLHRDKDGQVVKIMQHLSTGGRTTYFNSENPSISLTGGPEQPVLKMDLISGKMTVSGVNYKLTIPGGGMVFHQGGHYTFDPLTGWTQVGGPDDLWSGDFDALCAALRL